MNPKDMFIDLPADERDELAHLVDVSDGLQPGDQFIKHTEVRLKDAFAAKKEKTMKRFNLLWQVFAGTAAVAVLTLGIIWLVRIVAREPHNPSIPVGFPTVAAPGNTAMPDVTPVPAATSLPCDTVSYQVQANDTLASIAEKHSISVDELKLYNGLNTDMVLTGQSLVIPVCKQYTWRGTTVYRTANFPGIPADAVIYTHSASAAATIESARKLAERFGIQGDAYLDASGSMSATSYLVTDGKQRLSVSSSGEFSYYADYSKAFIEAPGSLATASGVIDSFLKTHGFDFDYKIEPANGIGPDWFYVIPLTLDGRQIRYDFGLMQGISIHVSSDGQIISLDAHLLSLDSKPVGKFGLISAEDAWQRFLKDASPGILQSSHGGGLERSLWQRTYPDNQLLTLYGSVQNFAPAEAGKSSFISVDGFTVTGNIAGMEKLAYNTFVQVNGQFFSENGIHKLKADSWQLFDQTNQQYLEGSLHKDGEKIIFASQGKEYSLEAVPADVPVPVENIAITGVPEGASLNWQYIMYAKNPAQGGGGGCGGSFAKLNLSGAPVPWPTFAPTPTAESLVGKRVEDQRGTLMIEIYQQADGSQRTEYSFVTGDNYYSLQGQQLDQLMAYHNRPLKIWGTIGGYNERQAPILDVERYEVLFPEAKFQVLIGKQKVITLEGQSVILFTTEDGKSYVQAIPIGLLPEGSANGALIGVEGDLVQMEVLAVPDETFGGYPMARVYRAGMVENPKTGQREPQQILADQPPHITVETLASSEETRPTLTIENIELVYYTPNPRYARDYPDAMSPYIQPVWRFLGHYSDGSEIEILIQALDQDFLLPEAAPAIQCG